MYMENQMHHFVALPENLDDINPTDFFTLDQSTLSSDEFRMYSYKITPCPRTRSHDWTSCPFAHHGERAKRRDLRLSYYAAIPCPMFKTGDCAKGDHCELAHGVFESWLHPAKYRTRKCYAGEFCRRNVCFFAHNEDQLRPETMYKRYLLNDPLNPSLAGWSTIGFESNGRIILPFLNRSTPLSATHFANQTSYGTVADSLAMLNIKDGEYELPMVKIRQPEMTIASTSNYEASCLNLNDLPQELKWVADLVKDS